MVASASERAATRRLEELRSIYGLPDGCVLNDKYVERTKIGRMQLFMVGLIAAAPDGSSVTGAAADDATYPVDRAYFELIERLTIYLARARKTPLIVRDARGAQRGKRAPGRVFPADEKPASLRVSLSNGVALHSSWPLACEAALSELVERDRVLRSFAGEYEPTPIDADVAKLNATLGRDYRVECYAFGPKRKTRRTAAGVFLFPQRATAPLAYGFGAARNVEDAIESAKREALQRLAFLWGEPLPSTSPAAAPTPDYHQEYYLYPENHALLRDWLHGKRRSARVAKRKPPEPPFDLAPVLFVDLAPDGVRGGLVVAKAVSPRARVLRFGATSSRRRTEPPHPIA